MKSPVGYVGLTRLRIGEQVLYKAGQDKWRVEATATVSRKPGTTGVFIRLDTFQVKGEESELVRGEEILAGANEIYK